MQVAHSQLLLHEDEFLLSIWNKASSKELVAVSMEGNALQKKQYESKLFAYKARNI